MKQTFQPHTFDFLVNTRHIDPDNNLAFIIKKIRKHGNRIAVDRQILGSSPLAKISLDSLNAFDALLFTLQSDPATPVPNIFEDLKAIFALVNTYITQRLAVGCTIPVRPAEGRTIPVRPAEGRTIPVRPLGGGAQYLSAH